MTNVMFKMSTKTNAIEFGILCAKSQNYLFDMFCNHKLAKAFRSLEYGYLWQPKNVTSKYLIFYVIGASLDRR